MSDVTFYIHGFEGVDEEARGWGPVQDEFQRCGVGCRIIRSPKSHTATPNQDRARIMVEALAGVSSDVALIGISNQGLFMPVVAAARPVRRIVFINGVVPFPGKSFLAATRGETVWANWIAGWLAKRAPGMNEVCPLTELPKVDYVYISAEKDEAIRPAWQAHAARDLLHVEPVIVPGAGHASILRWQSRQVVAAATAGLVAGTAAWSSC